ncbi:hypothetical protein AMS69_06975 [Haloarcula rubripromontorii]|uniref:Acyl-CoA dehydrogenase/oxidase N-terminal domain-containing protein n=1 Tax=Haloarcula rubripromontorii TaxID=1705562 RepID=A0A0N1IUM5_9EURY|nr:acyl-CoA dehydrogenase family protein [Haloarcula rubripromontorii]KOX93660.1 hypothetical protein AMS69_06975 [Haloarcula rubripromontorii]
MVVSVHLWRTAGIIPVYGTPHHRTVCSQTAVREAVQEFGDNEIKPHGADCDREKRYPAELVEQAAQYDLITDRVLWDR